MLFSAQPIPYSSTHSFSNIVLDYLSGVDSLQPFYQFTPTFNGLKEAIDKKQQQPLDRAALVNALQTQYAGIPSTEAVQQNIEALLSPNTFTICTAHQPNLFTGPLYLIYKILHTIKLAAALQAKHPQLHFVPVYYVGSEDADADELNHTYVGGQKYEWKTSQTGAVGRMLVDKALVALIDEMAGQLLTAPFGEEVVQLLKSCYNVGKKVQTALFELVNALMGKYGLVVLIADVVALKKQMLPIFQEDLFGQKASRIVEQTCQQLSKRYNVQANPRDINLFYLTDGTRERIVKVADGFAVHNTAIRFTEEELRKELTEHPERFSPNVILRGLYQETILPNIAFIGGGGELAYWLQLKNLFQHYKVPYPVLILRNSFLIIERKWQERIQKLGISADALFNKDLDIINAIIEQKGKKPQLNGEVAQLSALYDELKIVATLVDVTLNSHVEALKQKALNQLQNLEKKMQRAERKKHEAITTQLSSLKRNLFPNGGLQERVENFSTFYAKWGSQFIDALLQQSLTVEQEFVILFED